jgi:hypothetical protein
VYDAFSYYSMRPSATSGAFNLVLEPMYMYICMYIINVYRVYVCIYIYIYIYTYTYILVMCVCVCVCVCVCCVCVSV